MPALDERSLETYLEFEDPDLEANREGELSAVQRRRLRLSGVLRLVTGPPILVLGLVIAPINDNALVMLGGLAIAWFGLVLTWQGFAFLTDANENAVAYVTGPIHLKSVRGRYGWTYYANIGPVLKRITQVAFETLPEGMRCHLYYAPGCRSLLSVEPASAGEPKPPHPFGPDCAHAWNRVRWSWALTGVAVIGLLVGSHAVAVAHRAFPVPVTGTISNYVEVHGKSTTRSLYLAGDPDSYMLQAEYTYDPPAPTFHTMIGERVTIFVDKGTRHVIAIDDGIGRYRANWYLHPEEEQIYEAENGGTTAAVSALAVLAGIVGIAVGRRRLAQAAAGEAPPTWWPPYAPPTVHDTRALWPAVALLAFMMALMFLVLYLTLQR